MQVYEEKTDLRFLRAMANLSGTLVHLFFVYIL